MPSTSGSPVAAGATIARPPCWRSDVPHVVEDADDLAPGTRHRLEPGRLASVAVETGRATRRPRCGLPARRLRASGSRPRPPGPPPHRSTPRACRAQSTAVEGSERSLDRGAELRLARLPGGRDAAHHRRARRPDPAQLAAARPCSARRQPPSSSLAGDQGRAVRGKAAPRRGDRGARQISGRDRAAHRARRLGTPAQAGEGHPHVQLQRVGKRRLSARHRQGQVTVPGFDKRSTLRLRARSGFRRRSGCQAVLSSVSASSRRSASSRALGARRPDPQHALDGLGGERVELACRAPGRRSRRRSR